MRGLKVLGWSLYGVAIAGLLGWTLVSHTKVHKLNMQNEALVKTLNKKSDDYQAVQYQQSQTRYITSPNGKISAVSQDAMKSIKNVFTRATTWRNGRDYKFQLSQIQPFVTDKSIFKGNAFMGSKLDSSGNSVIDALQLKSKTKSVHVYATMSGNYLVTVDAVNYHNNVDLKNWDDLTATSTMFIVSTSGDQLTSIKQINHLSPITQLTPLG